MSIESNIGGETGKEINNDNRIIELGEDYDKTHKDLFEDLKNKDLYYKNRAEWIASEMSTDKEVEEINDMLENRTEEYFKSLIDSTTGLKRREALYGDMDKEISLTFGVENVKGMSDKELLDLINKLDPEDFKDAKLNVMMGDMAYLSLANEEGHHEGDTLLGHTGKIVKEELRDASRHGGDEFSALVKLNSTDSQESIEKLEKAVENGKNIPILERNNLKPKLDIGLAHFSEGLKVFKAVVGGIEEAEKGMSKEPGGKTELEKINVLKEFEDAWLDIADKRSSLKKAFERVDLLIKLKGDKDRPDIYANVIDCLRKGALGIKDHEVDELIVKIETGVNREDLINEYIERKEEENMSKLEGHRLIRARIIKEIVA